LFSMQRYPTKLWKENLWEISFGAQRRNTHPFWITTAPTFGLMPVTGMATRGSPPESSLAPAMSLSRPSLRRPRLELEDDLRRQWKKATRYRFITRPLPSWPGGPPAPVAHPAFHVHATRALDRPAQSVPTDPF
jgi:hypothetical protein